MTYSTDKRFKKRFEKKPKDRQAGVLKCIAQVTADPHNPGLRTKKLGTFDGREVFYSRISSGDRLTFHYDDAGNMVFRNHCFKHEVLRSP